MMLKAQATTRIDARQRGSIPLLGTIARNLRNEIETCLEGLYGGALAKGHVVQFLDADQQDIVQGICRRFDQVLGHRADYRAWRTGIRPSFRWRNASFVLPQSDVSSRWRHWEDDVLSAANSTCAEVAWGSIAISSAIIDHQMVNHPQGTRAAAWNLVRAVESRLNLLQPLPDALAGCGAAALLFLNKAQHLRYQENNTDTPTMATGLLGDMEVCLRQIDPNWQLGEKLAFGVLGREERAGRRLRTHGVTDEQDLILLAMIRVRDYVESVVTSYDAMGQDLFERAYLYSRSAWLTARSRRIQERLYHRHTRFTDPRADKKQKILLERESDWLAVTAVAAADAGRHLEAAKLHHLYFRHTPVAIIARALAYGKKRSYIFRSIKEAGLEVDDRFFPEAYASSVVSAPDPATPARAGNHRVETKRGQVGQLRGFQLKLATDQQSDPHWRRILRRVPVPESAKVPNRILSHVLNHVTKGAVTADSRTIRDLIVIARRYGQIRSHARLIRMLSSPTKDDVLDLAFDYKRCLQLNPFGLRKELIEEIREAVIAAWAMIDCKAISDLERFRLHEILMGRFIAAQKSMTAEMASLLLAKGYSLLDGEYLRNFYHEEASLLQEGPGTVLPQPLAEFSQSLASTALGAPVFVSVFQMGGRCSVVGLGQSGRLVSNDLMEPTLRSDVAHVQRSAKLWFRFPHGVRQVPWEKSIVRLGEAIAKVGKECDPTARTLILALQPQLSGLPWQNLLQDVVRSSGTDELVVSLVPNLGWTLLGRTGSSDVRRGFGVSPANDEAGPIEPEVRTLVDQTSSIARNPSNKDTDVWVAIGHGYPTAEGEIPSLSVGNFSLASFGDWEPRVQKSIVVVHSCHLGNAPAAYIGDYGALPGLALGLGCRVLCAPVAAVSTKAAATLNHHLFEREGPQEIGLRYLNAIHEDPSVALYTLYGLATPQVRLAET